MRSYTTPWEWGWRINQILLLCRKNRTRQVCEERGVKLIFKLFTRNRSDRVGHLDLVFAAMLTWCLLKQGVLFCNTHIYMDTYHQIYNISLLTHYIYHPIHNISLLTQYIYMEIYPPKKNRTKQKKNHRFVMIIKQIMYIAKLVIFVYFARTERVKFTSWRFALVRLIRMCACVSYCVRQSYIKVKTMSGENLYANHWMFMN